MSAHDFEFTSIDGKPLKLSQLAGKPVLVVNTAENRAESQRDGGGHKTHQARRCAVPEHTPLPALRATFPLKGGRKCLLRRLLEAGHGEVGSYFSRISSAVAPMRSNEAKGHFSAARWNPGFAAAALL